MRFKKLRISVGIAIVLFLLIVGNIIAFGLIKRVGASVSGDDDDSYINSRNAAIIDTDKSPSAITNSQQQQTTSSQPSSAAPSQPTIVHKTTRTAAS